VRQPTVNLKAATGQGLSLEEYTSILDMARDDPEIRASFFSAFGLRKK